MSMLFGLPNLLARRPRAGGFLAQRPATRPARTCGAGTPASWLGPGQDGQVVSLRGPSSLRYKCRLEGLTFSPRQRASCLSVDHSHLATSSPTSSEEQAKIVRSCSIPPAPTIWNTRVPFWEWRLPRWQPSAQLPRTPKSYRESSMSWRRSLTCPPSSMKSPSIFTDHWLSRLTTLCW